MHEEEHHDDVFKMVTAPASVTVVGDKRRPQSFVPLPQFSLNSVNEPNDKLSVPIGRFQHVITSLQRSIEPRMSLHTSLLSIQISRLDH